MLVMCSKRKSFILRQLTRPGLLKVKQTKSIFMLRAEQTRWKWNTYSCMKPSVKQGFGLQL